MSKKDSPADDGGQVAADFSSLFKATAERKSAEPATPETSNTRLITVEELEQIIADHKQSWKTHKQDGKPEPDFPVLTGVFDPRCLVEAAKEREAEYPWLPDLLENTGAGVWKYDGFVVFDKTKPVNSSCAQIKFSGSITLVHKGLGEVALAISGGRLVDLEIIALLF